MKHFLDRVKKLSFLSLPLCFFSLVLLDFSFRFFYQFAGDTELFALKPTLFTLGWALLLTALISLLPRLGKRIAMMALILLFSVLTLVHGVLFHLTGSMFSFSDLNFAGDGAKFFSWTYLNLRKAFLLCLFASVLLMAFAAFLAPKGESRCNLVEKAATLFGCGGALSDPSLLHPQRLHAPGGQNVVGKHL